MKLKSLNRYLSFLILFIFCPLLNAEEEIDIWNKTKEEKSKVITQKKKNAQTVNAGHTENRGSMKFWFTRSDFYVTGLDFVCSRIAIMT